MAEQRVVDNPAAQRFEVRLDQELVGYAEYRDEAGLRVFTHTVVEPRFEGQGLGSALARGALDAARAAGLGVLPYCPFIRGYIERHPAYLDLVPVSRRAAVGLAGTGADPPTPAG